MISFTCQGYPRFLGAFRRGLLILNDNNGFVLRPGFVSDLSHKAMSAFTHTSLHLLLNLANDRQGSYAKCLKVKRFIICDCALLVNPSAQ